MELALHLALDVADPPAIAPNAVATEDKLALLDESGNQIVGES